ncbi:LLM class flavin-dependent oxidoreductase [Bradyrhizobium genosp. P]|uniref:LLM class flavin-dependent oxidoreductase n=1 Tax=Bradyrhizobium genosp. P TaxID=83641 RepID=UPI003CF4FED3
MKLGLFYEHQLPQPWHEGSEQKLLNDALEQIELADRLGFDHVWEVEHHFLEEYSHSSAPEVFLGAVSQRTRNIRIGHGICLSPPNYNHPARVAERIATLDLISGGRVEWGTGESASLIEMHGFGIEPEQKSAMWHEGVEQTANMLTMRPYPGYEGRFFTMPDAQHCSQAAAEAAPAALAGMLPARSHPARCPQRCRCTGVRLCGGITGQGLARRILPDHQVSIAVSMVSASSDTRLRITPSTASTVRGGQICGDASKQSRMT